ncbi:hypothetical protein CR970_01535 [Candidatus Saccharibacteria bacterium]|nr:MAG: hypothetical protein CR970_01535 [Candidatus Saccharibacteria bacterium]
MIVEDKGVVQTVEDSFLELIEGAVNFLPKLLAALILIWVGLVVARLVSKIVGRVVDYMENSKAVTSTLESIGVKSIDVDGVVSLFVRWSIVLIFLSAAVDVLKLNALTQTFNSLVSFVPNVLAAAAIAGLALFAANAIYEVVFVSAKKAHVAAHGVLAGVARVAVLVFGLPLAAAQLGLDMTIITNNITVVVAGIMLAFGLAFGLGGKEVAAKILNDAHKNWKK